MEMPFPSMPMLSFFLALAFVNVSVVVVVTPVSSLVPLALPLLYLFRVNTLFHWGNRLPSCRRGTNRPRNVRVSFLCISIRPRHQERAWQQAQCQLRSSSFSSCLIKHTPFAAPVSDLHRTANPSPWHKIDESQEMREPVWASLIDSFEQISDIGNNSSQSRLYRERTKRDGCDGSTRKIEGRDNMSNMTIMVLGFVIFTTFVPFFGTAMAHLAWKVFEKDSDRVIQRSRENKPAAAAPSKTQARAHAARRPTQPPTAVGVSGSHAYADKKQTIPTNTSNV